MALFQGDTPCSIPGCHVCGGPKKTLKGPDKPADTGKEQKKETDMGIAGVYPWDQMAKGETKQLMHAMMLYQPVKGTSQNSRYFVIALSNKLRVAARWMKNNSMSIRVEGAGAADPNMADRLIAAGLDRKSQYYWSLHCEAETESGVIRVIGAVLLSLEEEWLTPFPYDIRKIRIIGEE